MCSGKFFVIVSALTLAAWPLFAASYSPKASKPEADTAHKKSIPGADIFDNKHVLDLRIEISRADFRALQQDNRNEENRPHVRATVHEGATVWHDVDLHLKGKAGSFQPIGSKPGLTLTFPKFVEGQKFHGLKRIHLNNSVQDSSYMTENICSELFRLAGVPTPRVSYAVVHINGERKGLYVLKEGFTKDMLGLYFKNTRGNLYDGGFLRDITEPLEKDMGDDDVDDRSDLKALVKAAREPDTTRRFEALSQVLDVDRFISFAALEVIMWDWDGYLMKRNNYRVYHDLDTGKMVFFPHGMDQMFWDEPSAILPSKVYASLIGHALLKTPQGRTLYLERFGQLYTNLFRVEWLTNRVAELTALLRPHADQGFPAKAREKRHQIIQRFVTIASQLSEPSAQPLEFQDGIARVSDWKISRVGNENNTAKLERAGGSDGKRALHIKANSKTAASWRTTVLLEPGEYQFEVMAKTAGVVPELNPKKGEGAGIRNSQSQTARTNKLIGDSSWQKLVHHFTVEVPNPEELLCELRASEGEVWFDLDSFRLVRVK